MQAPLPQTSLGSAKGDFVVLDGGVLVLEDDEDHGAQPSFPKALPRSAPTASTSAELDTADTMSVAIQAKMASQRKSLDRLPPSVRALSVVSTRSASSIMDMTGSTRSVVQNAPPKKKLTLPKPRARLSTDSNA